MMMMMMGKESQNTEYGSEGTKWEEMESGAG